MCVWGGQICVFEGRYKEAINLTKPLEILGVGVLNDIVVECSDSRPVVWSWAQYAKVLNITLQQARPRTPRPVQHFSAREGAQFWRVLSRTSVTLSEPLNLRLCMSQKDL